MSALSKYIISFLFAVVVVQSILLAINIKENKALHKQIVVQKEEIALKDKALNEVDKNIERLIDQVKNAEEICKNRIKARQDLLVFLGSEPPENKAKTTDTSLDFPSSIINIKHTGSQNYIRGVEPSATPPKLTQDNKRVINDEKSSFAINSINSYWMQYTLTSDSKK